MTDKPATESAPEERRVFRPKLVVSLIALGMLVILVMLGNWQRRRYFEATDGIAFHHTQHDELPALTHLNVDIKGDPSPKARLAKLQYRRAELRGVLEIEKTQLLTARYMFGKRGYGVMAPLRLDKGPHRRVLAHLGWVPQEHVAGFLAQLKRAPERTVSGRLQVTPETPVQRPTGEHLGHPTWIRPFPLGMVSTIEDLEPRLLLQAGDLAVGRPVDPDKYPLTGYAHPVRMNPNKHVEYAATWYGLAATLVVVWFALSLKRVAPVGEGVTEQA